MGVRLWATIRSGTVARLCNPAIRELFAGRRRLDELGHEPQGARRCRSLAARLWLVTVFSEPRDHYDSLGFVVDPRPAGTDDVTWEVLNHEDWTSNLVANVRDGNVFIAGDAAPLGAFAGYGMNAGIADGIHVAWLLAAVIDGWAPETILEAYEAERLPITDQVSRLAIGKVMENAAALGGGRVPATLSDSSKEGIELRAQLGAVLYDINVPQFAPIGLNFGYFYDKSPIIAYDGRAAGVRHGRDHKLGRPRLPHASLRGRRSAIPRSPSGPTTRSFASTAESTLNSFVVTARARGLPLLVINAQKTVLSRRF
jgi:hypothetical protein